MQCYVPQSRRAIMAENVGGDAAEQLAPVRVHHQHQAIDQLHHLPRQCRGTIAVARRSFERDDAVEVDAHVRKGKRAALRAKLFRRFFS